MTDRVDIRSYIRKLNKARDDVRLFLNALRHEDCPHNVELCRGVRDELKAVRDLLVPESLQFSLSPPVVKERLDAAAAKLDKAVQDICKINAAVQQSSPDEMESGYQLYMAPEDRWQDAPDGLPKLSQNTCIAIEHLQRAFSVARAKIESAYNMPVETGQPERAASLAGETVDLGFGKPAAGQQKYLWGGGQGELISQIAYSPDEGTVVIRPGTHPEAETKLERALTKLDRPFTKGRPDAGAYADVSFTVEAKLREVIGFLFEEEKLMSPAFFTKIQQSLRSKTKGKDSGPAL